MRTLVIDSATEACSVALFDGPAMLAGDYRLLGRGHAEDLVPMIAALPDNGRADRIAVALGPGSFTGVRVGIAAARALALAWKCELVGYPTLGLVAAMAQAKAGAEPCTIVMTGGHGEWFVQSFGPDGLPNGEFASLDPASAATAVSSDLVAGTQAEALVARHGCGRAIALHPDARSFGLMPESLISAVSHPIYGRAPDARLPTP